jgi:hypothetical protein
MVTAAWINVERTGDGAVAEPGGPQGGEGRGQVQSLRAGPFIMLRLCRVRSGAGRANLPARPKARSLSCRAPFLRAVGIFLSENAGEVADMRLKSPPDFAADPEPTIESGEKLWQDWDGWKAIPSRSAMISAAGG